MSGAMDKIKGKAKEAIGALTDDEGLKNSGKVDQAAGKTKDKLEDAKDAVSATIDSVKAKVKKA